MRRLGLRGRAFAGVGGLIAAYALLLGLLQCAMAVRDRRVALLFAEARYEAEIETARLGARNYILSPESLDPASSAVMRGSLRSKLRKLWTLSGLLPGDRQGVGRMASAVNGRQGLHGAAPRKALLARLKSGKNLARLEKERHRRELLESVEEMGTLIFRAVWALAALTSLLALAGTWYFTNGLLARIRRLQEALRRAAAGRLEPLGLDEPDELGTLAAGFNEMARLLSEERSKKALGAKTEGLALAAAHALNNPLTAIIGYADLLLGGAVDEEAKSDLRRIREQAQRCHRAVQSLAASARPDARADRIRVNEVIQGALRCVADDLRLAGVALSTHLGEDLPEVAGSAARLESAFGGILSEALKALKDSARRELRVASERVGESLRVTFADSANGRCYANAAGSLDAFFEALGAANGAGLGLSEAYGAIRSHGGSVTVASRGDGTVVLVELPIT